MAAGKKTGGRTKGVPNKATGEMRNVFAEFLVRNADQVQVLWNELESPRDKLWFILQGAEFALPKLGRIEASVKVAQDGPMTIEHVIVTG